MYLSDNKFTLLSVGLALAGTVTLLSPFNGNRALNAQQLAQEVVVVMVPDEDAICPCWTAEQLNFSMCQFALNHQGIETTRLLLSPEHDASVVHDLFQATAGDVRDDGNGDDYYTCQRGVQEHNGVDADDDRLVKLSMSQYEACAKQLVKYCIDETRERAPKLDLSPTTTTTTSTASCPCWPEGFAPYGGISLEQVCEAQFAHPHGNKVRLHYLYNCHHDGNTHQRQQHGNRSNGYCEAVVRQDFAGNAYCAHQDPAGHLVHVKDLDEDDLATCFGELFQQCEEFATSSFLLAH